MDAPNNKILKFLIQFFIQSRVTLNYVKKVEKMPKTQCVIWVEPGVLYLHNMRYRTDPMVWYGMVWFQGVACFPKRPLRDTKKLYSRARCSEAHTLKIRGRLSALYGRRHSRREGSHHREGTQQFLPRKVDWSSKCRA